MLFFLFGVCFLRMGMCMMVGDSVGGSNIHLFLLDLCGRSGIGLHRFRDLLFLGGSAIHSLFCLHRHCLIIQLDLLVCITFLALLCLALGALASQLAGLLVLLSCT